MMYNSLCVGAELRESRFNHLINGSTNVLFYNIVIIVHYVLRTKREVEEASEDVFERRTLTGSGPFSFIDIALAQIFGQIISMRVKTLCNTNLAASSHNRLI